jgi:hypothetical protein
MPATRTFAFELRFLPLRDGGRSIAVPCTAEGHVDIDRLDTRQRLDYYFARTVIGREFARPAVQVTLH